MGQGNRGALAAQQPVQPYGLIMHVLIESARMIIEYGQSLDILHHVHRGREKWVTMIPTWVPDWTSKEVADEIAQYTAAASAQGEEVFFNKSDRSTFQEPEYRTDDSGEGDVHLRACVRQLCVIEEVGTAELGYPWLRISR